MYASINNSTDVKTDTIIGYISPAGIPSVASQKDQYLEVVTPYSVFPTVLFDKAVGLAWWRNMIVGKKMQSKSNTKNPMWRRWRGNAHLTPAQTPTGALSLRGSMASWSRHC